MCYRYNVNELALYNKNLTNYMEKLKFIFLILIFVCWSCQNKIVGEKNEESEKIEEVGDDDDGESDEGDEKDDDSKDGDDDESEGKDEEEVIMTPNDIIASNLSKKGSNDWELLIGNWRWKTFAYTKDGDTISELDSIFVNMSLEIEGYYSSWYLKYTNKWIVHALISNHFINLRCSNPYATPLNDERNLIACFEKAYSFVIKDNELIIYFTDNDHVNLIILKRKSPEDVDIDEPEDETPGCEICDDDSEGDVPYLTCPCERELQTGVSDLLSGIEVYLFKDSIQGKIAHDFYFLTPHPVCWIILGSEFYEPDEVVMFVNRTRTSGGQKGLGWICNFPDFARKIPIPQNGCKVYIEGLVTELCYGSTADRAYFNQG